MKVVRKYCARIIVSCLISKQVHLAVVEISESRNCKWNNRSK